MTDRWTHPITKRPHPGWARSTELDDLAHQLATATRPAATGAIAALTLGLVLQSTIALYAAAGLFTAIAPFHSPSGILRLRAWQWWRRADRASRP